MPTHFLGPQSAPTVVTCLPRNAVLIRFTYEIILRFTTLKTLTLLVEKSDLHVFETNTDQNSQTRPSTMRHASEPASPKLFNRDYCIVQSAYVHHQKSWCSEGATDRHNFLRILKSTKVQK